jgi:hypothetical protein
LGLKTSRKDQLQIGNLKKNVGEVRTLEMIRVSQLQQLPFFFHGKQKNVRINDHFWVKMTPYKDK